MAYILLKCCGFSLICSIIRGLTYKSLTLGLLFPNYVTHITQELHRLETKSVVLGH